MTRKKLFFFSLAALLSFFSSAPDVLSAPEKMEKNPASASIDKAVDAEQESTSYIIGASNLLQIKVFGEASINQLYRVDEDGYIKHALAGRLRLGGLTVSEAERLVEQRLDGDYIINPQVSIFVLEYSHFSIIGEVRRPGNYEIFGRVSVMRALSMAGGFTPIANQRGVQIIRKNTDGTESKVNVDATRIMQGDLSDEQDLQADDVVVVTKSFF